MEMLELVEEAMKVTVHRWPVLEILKGEEGARRFRRTKQPCQTMVTDCEILPRSLHVYFGNGDWRDFYFEGHSTTDTMRDWVIDKESVKEVAKERVRQRQELRKSLDARHQVTISGVKT